MSRTATLSFEVDTLGEIPAVKQCVEKALKKHRRMPLWRTTLYWLGFGLSKSNSRYIYNLPMRPVVPRTTISLQALDLRAKIATARIKVPTNPVTGSYDWSKVEKELKGHE